MGIVRTQERLQVKISGRSSGRPDANGKKVSFRAEKFISFYTSRRSTQWLRFAA
jgi:hypothetical protein